MAEFSCVVDKCIWNSCEQCTADSPQIVQEVDPVTGQIRAVCSDFEVY